MEPAIVHLKPGRDKSVRNRNPWVFSGAVDRIEGCAERGQPAVIVSSRGEFLAAGYVNPDSRIPCRILAWEPVPVGRELVETRILAAVASRTLSSLGLRAGDILTVQLADGSQMHLELPGPAPRRRRDSGHYSSEDSTPSRHVEIKP